jgi:GxxExxY protein
MESEGAKKYDLEVLNRISYEVVGAALKVHSQLGPGLLESVYEICLLHELVKMGYQVESQKQLPVFYDCIKINAGFRLDLVVNGSFIVEIKVVDSIHPVHSAQLNTYLILRFLCFHCVIQNNSVCMPLLQAQGRRSGRAQKGSRGIHSVP